VAGIRTALLAGANPNAFEGTDGWTPLQWAALHGRVAAIAALLAAGARVDGPDYNGTTALMRAALSDHTAAVAALLAAGADVHRATTSGHTALHTASTCGHLDAARLLLRAGARADVCTKNGRRPIDEARAPACSLDASALSHHAAAPLHRRAQACQYSNKSAVSNLRALFASAAAWSRRRPVALACYGMEWDWEA
jgi:ankyrin repeat protein